MKNEVKKFEEYQVSNHDGEIIPGTLNNPLHAVAFFEETNF